MKYVKRVLIVLSICLAIFAVVQVKEALSDTKKIDINQKPSLMIVAHPDDETLWGGLHLIEGNYYIVCITNGDNLIRKKEFQQVLDITNSKGEILSFPDKVDGQRSDWENDKDEIRKELEKIISSKDWDMIVTHNKKGEYGHNHHKMIDQIVTSIAKKDGKQDHLYYFGTYYKFNEMTKATKTLNDKQSELKQELFDIYKSQKKTVNKFSHMRDFECFKKATNGEKGKCY